jgi:DHA2 family multidrug resistance protein-like MFS transporter
MDDKHTRPSPALADPRGARGEPDGRRAGQHRAERALKTIQEDLGATQNEIVWAINSYTLVFAALLFTWGVLGDRYGRKKILIIGLLLFGLASALSAFAHDPMQLILARAFMGIGGASVLPVTLAIITVVFPPHERGRAIGMWAAAVGGAVAIGPLLGGFLLEHYWWGSVFLINVPIVIAGVIGIAILVPESRNPNPGRLDPLGLVLSITGLLLLVYGIQHGGDTQDWLPGTWQGRSWPVLPSSCCSYGSKSGATIRRWTCPCSGSVLSPRR